MGLDISQLPKPQEIVNQTPQGPALVPNEVQQFLNSGTQQLQKPTESPNEGQQLQKPTESPNEGQQLQKPTESLNSGTQQLQRPTEFVTESVEFTQALTEADIDSFDWSGKIYCHKVLVFPGLTKNLPKEISLYVFTDVSGSVDQTQKLLGMIISVSDDANLTPMTRLSFEEFIEFFLNSDIAKTLEILVLHQITINYNLIKLVASLNLRRLHLDDIFFGRGSHEYFNIFFPKTLERLHISLNREVTDDITFQLPKNLNKLSVCFGPTTNPSKRPIKFEGQCAASLTTM